MTCEHGRNDPLKCLACAMKFGVTRAFLEFGLMLLITLVIGSVVIFFHR